jgi:tetratricopeptide (TPR) repeat protein
VPDAPVQFHPLRALRRLASVAATCAALAACAAPEPFRASPADIARAASVTDVPLIRQADFYCGPASLAMVMQWSGHDITQAEIARQSFTPGARGTYLADMLGAARRHGQIAVTLDTFPALLAEIEAGHPVIVFQNLGLPIAPVWHYGVVVGYDLDTEVVALHSGQREVMRMPLRAFLKSWDGGDRWGMVVLPPDRHPARADETALLRAAAALERVGQFQAAEIAYRRGAARWPGNWLWPFGLGNALYGQDKLPEARRAFRRALTLDPEAQAARNNLAQIEAAPDV